MSLLSVQKYSVINFIHCAQSQTYSTYKGHSTANGLVSIAPNEFVTFVSHLYRGQVSNKAMTQHCGLIDLLEPGDVDKGVDMQHLLVPRRQFPPFTGGNERLTL